MTGSANSDVTLRILQDQTAVQEQTVSLSRQAVGISLNEYRAGTQTYTTVVTAQATALTAAQILLAIRQNRLVASVSLIRAMSGGLDGCCILKACAAQRRYAGRACPSSGPDHCPA